MLTSSARRAATFAAQTGHAQTEPQDISPAKWAPCLVRRITTDDATRVRPHFATRGMAVMSRMVSRSW